MQRKLNDLTPTPLLIKGEGQKSRKLKDEKQKITN